jgi:crotonobetainyl-CoA:carnitine CoA-transferase CaiB-like acyl-CoA transferase
VSAYLGLRVVDFTQGVAGPMAAMLLGDFGAEVIKVEPPEGDRLARAPGYLGFNRNKQVLTLDLAAPEGMDAARRLIAGADVAIFDHAPSRLGDLDFTAEALTQAFPRLIHAWMPPYGAQGPMCETPPRYSLLSGATGWGWRQGADTDRPVHLVLPTGWHGQGVMGATAIGAALLERARSGRGQGLVVSGLHGMAQVGGPCRVKRLPPLPRAVSAGVHPRYRVFRCGDGQFFFLGALFATFYRKLFEALGYGDVVEAFATDDEGTRNLLDAVFETRPRDEWIELLQAHDVPCAPIGTREAWFESETIRDAGLRLTFDHPELGEVALPGPAVELSATPATVRALPQAIAGPPAWAPRDPAAGSPERRAPLAGVRVLNLGTVIAGAFPGAILSYFGADVVKIEPPEGDAFRYDPQSLGYNRGSRSLCLDLKRPEARGVFLDMVREADVVIDNYRPGVRERLGIDYPALRAINPRIISCSVTTYGHTGPRAARPGFDPLLQAEGGMMAAQGGADDPVFLTMAVDDVGAAGMTCASIMAALNVRERTGEGQQIRTSLMAISLLFQLGELVTYAGRPPNDLGGRDCVGLRALHRYYACADGWLGIACESPAELDALARALGIDLAPQDDALAAPCHGALAERLETAFAAMDRADALDRLLAAGVPAGPAVRTEEVIHDPWLAQNRYVEGWEHPVYGPVTGVRGFADLLATPCAFQRPSPQLGEHSSDVLRQFGFSAERIESLLADRVVLDSPPGPRLVGAEVD